MHHATPSRLHMPNSKDKGTHGGSVVLPSVALTSQVHHMDLHRVLDELDASEYACVTIAHNCEQP
jgi:hypothetical protein